jgi:hypothetical protein
MDQQIEVQQEFNARAFQEVSPAAYPQLCGSWPGDEWPEDDISSSDWQNALAHFCLPAEYACEVWA